MKTIIKVALLAITAFALGCGSDCALQSDCSHGQFCSELLECKDYDMTVVPDGFDLGGGDLAGADLAGSDLRPGGDLGDAAANSDGGDAGAGADDMGIPDDGSSSD